MRYSIWYLLIGSFVLFIIIGILFILGISFFFYNFHINQSLKENSVNIEILSNSIAGPSWTLKESYPGTIENILKGTLIHNIKFARLFNEEDRIIEKSGDEKEIGKKILHPPLFERKLNIRDGVFNEKPIKEFSIRNRDGTNLWVGISFENIRKNILSASINLAEIILILITLLIISMFLFSKNIIIKPLISLIDAFEKLQAKEYDVHLEGGKVIETQKVFESFNSMVKKVEIAELQLKNEIERIKEIDKLKSEFISVAAHQLRTPLSAVKWTLKMVVDEDLGKLTPEQKTFLMQGYKSNERMIKLVNDFLNVVRIEEGRFGYNFSQIQLEDLIDLVIREFSHPLKEKNIKLIFKKPEKLLPKVNIDSSRMNLVIQNLTDNAIKYTPNNGEVTISIKYSKMYLEVAIKDNGVGIPEKQQEKIFSKFFRSDNIIRMQTEGTGLGLFIVKNIIEKHGGKVWFDSEENKGTTFYFTIPVKKDLDS